MQDFKHFDYVIDFDGMIKAVKAGQNINVIINGEIYDFTPQKEDGEKKNVKMDQHTTQCIQV